jgi:hypothetical protein
MSMIMLRIALLELRVERITEFLEKNVPKSGSNPAGAVGDENMEKEIKEIDEQKCQCECGCDNPATTVDDGGFPVCEECSLYVVDEYGDVHCSKSDDVEVIQDSWGRSITRFKPPKYPEEDPEGEYALWWESTGDESHLEGRFSTLEEAKQALTSMDWPKPGDNTKYLCGYGIRKLVDDEWIFYEEEW